MNDLSEVLANLPPIHRISATSMSSPYPTFGADCRMCPRTSIARNMCSASSGCAVVSPPSEGDLEFLLDFGEEIVGFIEFELNAGGGQIIDFNCFEAIVDSQWSWTDNLRNTLRYTTKEGWQRFHSVVRRGLRYAQVTIRNATRPVRIHEIRCIKNTYPVQHQGHFNGCEHPLNRIWEIGRRTAQMCMEDTFVDCPTLRAGFLGGSFRNEALAALAASVMPISAKRCLKLARRIAVAKSFAGVRGSRGDGHEHYSRLEFLVGDGLCGLLSIHRRR